MVRRRKPDGPTVLKLKCFNQDEANKATEYMRANHPDVEFFASYLTWPKRT